MEEKDRTWLEKKLPGKEEYIRTERKLIHKGQITEVYSDYMRLPNGNEAVWDFIKHKGAAAIVPVDEEGRIILVRQYRNALERYTLEIPAGGINPGEDRRTCAIRELEEETGYASDRMEHLLDVYTAVAYCDEKISIYYTDDLKLSKQHLDADEFIHIERYSEKELKEMILNGTIEDSKTVSGVLAYFAKINK